MNSILLVDDDILVHEIVKKSLRSYVQVEGCFNLADARSYLEQNQSPVMILIDRILPDGDGLSLCSEIRSNEFMNSMPIIFLSGCVKESDKLSGFYAGADDYIAKPFSPLELKARIEARLRSSSSGISFGNISVNLDKHAVLVHSGDKALNLNLTLTEYKILVALVKNRDRVLNREVLLGHVWERDFSVSDRVVDTHISHLRTKLSVSDVTIECLRGLGYRLVNSQALAKKAS